MAKSLCPQRLLPQLTCNFTRQALSTPAGCQLEAKPSALISRLTVNTRSNLRARPPQTLRRHPNTHMLDAGRLGPRPGDTKADFSYATFVNVGRSNIYIYIQIYIYIYLHLCIHMQKGHQQNAYKYICMLTPPPGPQVHLSTMQASILEGGRPQAICRKLCSHVLVQHVDFSISFAVRGFCLSMNDTHPIKLWFLATCTTKPELQALNPVHAQTNANIAKHGPFKSWHLILHLAWHFLHALSLSRFESF